MTSVAKLRVEDLDDAPEDGNRYEIIDGELFVSPAPSMKHQRIVARLQELLGSFAHMHKLGQVYPAPTEIVLDAHTSVQPDLLFVSRANQGIETEQRIEGSPDLVIEVLSPSSKNRDTTLKASRYARAGIPNYWIVDPKLDNITLLEKSGDVYVKTAWYERDAQFTSSLFPGLSIDMSYVFE